MNQRRGDFDTHELEALVRSIQSDLEDLPLELGLSSEEVMKYLSDLAPLDEPSAEPAADETKGGPVKDGALPVKRPEAAEGAASADVKMTYLFFSAAQSEAFAGMVRDLGAVLGKTTATDVVWEVVKDAHARLATKDA
jgi:hypothetical protein